MIHYLFNPKDLPENFGIQVLIEAAQKQGISGSDQTDFIQSIKTAIDIGKLPASKSETDDTSVHFLQSIERFSWKSDENQISFCKRGFLRWLHIRGLNQQRLLLRQHNKKSNNVYYDMDGVEATVSQKLLVLALVYYKKWDGIGLSDTHPTRAEISQELGESMLFAERVLNLLPVVIKPLWARKDEILVQLGRDKLGQWEYEQKNLSIWYVEDTLKKVHVKFWGNQTETPITNGIVERELISHFKQYGFSDSVIKILSSLIRPAWAS